ncbi:hypothetical protein MANES_02G213432v8 [Manihot esculenta]|uniref:Uncharacterized protein n=2 Tax=Manihot esculenta TaxID=3983 RepID=A0ACB7H5B5_MANES|nr:hypothetical protein MANES_09G124750v8 [Manihot esculenta]KAG8661129.1 hypothetical protein MANES_02G213432v8 [Manihot esculenta]
MIICLFARKVSCFEILVGLGLLHNCGYLRKNGSKASEPQACKSVLGHHLVLYLRTRTGT